MATYQNEMTELDDKIAAEMRQGMTDDHPVMQEMKRHKEELQKLIDAEIQQAAHDSRVAEAASKSLYLLDSIQIAGVPVKECGMEELAFSILRDKIQDMFVSQAEENSNIIKGYEDREIQLKRQNDELQKEVGDSYSLKLQLNEALQNRDNAASQMEKTNAENETLKKKIATLEAPITATSTEQISQQEEKFRASRIKVTSMVKNDPSGISDRLWDIVLLETGEQKTINYLEKGKYAVVSEEEAARFHAEEAEKAASVPVPMDEPKLPDPEVTPDSFQEASQTETNATVPFTGMEGNGQEAGDLEATTQANQQGQAPSVEARLSQVEQQFAQLRAEFDAHAQQAQVA